jgi:wyosine [tRNA(Phe)-imidazoG37] synthetase (radical SAM superfamily)
MNNQPNISVHNYLAQVQALYIQYMQIKTQIDLLEKNLEATSSAFDAIPTQQNLLVVQNAWNQKFTLMQQLPLLVNNIVANLTEATKLALSLISMNISSANKINLVLNDNAIATICTFLEQSNNFLFLKELFRQYCITQNIPMQMSNVEILLRMSKNNMPNFDHLKAIINGY